MITIDNITFDTDNKRVIVSESIERIDLSVIYSRSVDWIATDDMARFYPPMKYSGYDLIPSGFTGATFFMYNGWKLVVNLNTTAIEGVLFSEDYQTGYWNSAGLPINPIVIAATVNTVYKEVGTSGLTTDESILLNKLATKNDVIIASQL